MVVSASANSFAYSTVNKPTKIEAIQKGTACRMLNLNLGFFISSNFCFRYSLGLNITDISVELDNYPIAMNSKIIIAKLSTNDWL